MSRISMTKTRKVFTRFNRAMKLNLTFCSVPCDAHQETSHHAHRQTDFELSNMNQLSSFQTDISGARIWSLFGSFVNGYLATAICLSLTKSRESKTLQFISPLLIPACLVLFCSAEKVGGNFNLHSHINA